MIVAVCPVAFFTQEHIDMTERFLDALAGEVDRIGVWHNGGPLWNAGGAMLATKPVEIFGAEGWNFYWMWNAGAAWAQELGADAALFLNNDIEWPTGALRALADALVATGPDVATASPDPDAASLSPTAVEDIGLLPAYRGLLGWCFAVKPTYWQNIDERYQVWWGDDELGILMHEAGWRCVRAKGIPVYHPVNESTFRYRDNLWPMRYADEAVFQGKWHRP